MLNIRVKLALSAILALVFIGCGGGSNEYPKDVAIEFAKKSANGDVKGAMEMMKPYSIEKSGQCAKKPKNQGA